MFLFNNTKEQIRGLLELMVVGERLEELLELDVIQDYINENYISKEDYVINLNKLEVSLKKESGLLISEKDGLKDKIKDLENKLQEFNETKKNKEKEESELKELKYKFIERASKHYRYAARFNSEIMNELVNYRYIQDLADLCNMSIIEFVYSDLINEVMNQNQIKEYKKEFDLKLAESYSKEEERKLHKRNIKMSIDQNEFALKNIKSSIESNNKSVLKYEEEIKKLNENLKKLEELDNE